MKVITIGDLHGSTAWEKVKPGDWDRIIFIGDYVDSFYFENDQILDNLLKVIKLKKKHPGKIILLWGNHDLAYLFRGNHRHYCSGFRDDMMETLFDLFIGNRDLLQAAFQMDKYLWTHAGVVNQWYQTSIKDQIKPDDDNLAGTLNRLFDEYYQPLFDVSFYRGGRDKHGGIFWADKSELLDDPLWDYHQIIGHTKTGNGILRYVSQDEGTSLTYTDCLETKTEFFEQEI